MEEYRVIESFPNYQISNFGNVKNISSNRILVPSLTNGYNTIGLTMNSKQKRFTQTELTKR